MTQSRTIELARTIGWRYQCLPAVMICALYGDEVPVEVSLRSEATRGVPDVLEVEAWLRQHLKEPTTVEQLAVAGAERWGMTCEAKGESANHGVITATAY